MAANNNRKAYSNKGKGKATYRKKYGPTPEEDAAVKAFFAESPKREKQNAGEQSYQAADHETPKAKMENPLPLGNKGLAGSRYATKMDEEVKNSTLLPQGQKVLAASHLPHTKKYGPTPEEDAAVKAFFAESPKREKQNVGEQSYQAADHETPKAKMENPLPLGNKGLAGSCFAKEEDPKQPPAS